MKTIEERAREIRRNFYSPSGDESELIFIARHLRELAEDYALICDNLDCEPEKFLFWQAVANAIAEKIRAHAKSNE